jgi:hypothetical protein
MPQGRSLVSNMADTEDPLALPCEQEMCLPQSAVDAGLLTHVLNT